MLTVKHNLAKDHGCTGDVEILPLADFHIGDGLVDKKLIRKLLSWPMEAGNRFCVLNGDIMDTAIQASIGSTYDATLTPEQQLHECVKLFKPLADAGKILAVTGGNHEARITRHVGVDMTRLMCAQLGIEDRYSEGAIVMFVMNGAQKGQHKRKGKPHQPYCYSVFLRHGSGGGSTIGGKANALAKSRDVADCDLYIGSHTHQKILFDDTIFRTDRQHATITQCERKYVNTPAALAYGGYAEAKGLAPASRLHWPIITLHGDEQYVEVSF